MVAYLLRRTLFSVLIVVLASVAIFTVVEGIAEGPFGSSVTWRSLCGAYVVWVVGTLRGDLGDSHLQHATIYSIVALRAWPTILLMGSSLALTVVFAVPFGAYLATKKRSALDKVGRAFFYVGYSLPVFWLGALLQLVLGVYLANWAGVRFFYSSGISSPAGSGLVDLLQHLFLPVVTLSLASIAQFARFQRASMLEVLSEDYVRTARAKGLGFRAIHYKHALRNAMLPTLTLFALSMGAISGGAVVVETVFAWPGLGYLLIESIFRGDYPVVRVLLMLNVVFVVFFNLLADLAYVLLEPRASHD